MHGSIWTEATPMQPFKIISTLLLMLALIIANRQELTIYEDGHSGGLITHLEELHDHHEHEVTSHLHMDASTPHHHHHYHVVMDLDIIPIIRDALVRFLLVSLMLAACVTLLTTRLTIRSLRHIDYPPWPRWSDRVSRIGGAGYCRPMLN